MVNISIPKEEIVSIDSLSVDGKNPNTMSSKEREALKYSIEKYGFIIPIITNKDLLIADGQHRWEVAKEMGLNEVKIVRLPIKDVDRRILRQVLNKLRGQHDKVSDLEEYDKIFKELGNLDELKLLIPNEDYGNILAKFEDEGREDNLDIEEAIKQPKYKIERGDLWALGDHRMMCGDATEKSDVERLMGGQKADMVFTSPPYWVGLEYENEQQKQEIIHHIDKSSKNMAMATNKRIVINTGNISSITTAERITGKKQPVLLIDWWLDSLNKNNFLLRHIRVWSKMGGIKPNRSIDKIDMHWEYIMNTTTEDYDGGFISTFYQEDTKPSQIPNKDTWAVKGIWNDIQGNARQSGHIASYPIILVARYVMMYVGVGDIVYDPYGGSGTTTIACEQLKRKCYMMEIDPIYCSVIIERWEKYTGAKAKKLS